MPSIEAPTYYDRSKGIMPNKYDQFFKLATLDFTLSDTGTVESPLGFVMLIKVDEEMQNTFLNEYVLRQDVSADLCYTCRNKFGVPDTGWYVTRQDDNGIIWAMEYGPLDSTLAEESARADFAEAEKVAAAWDRANDQEY